MSNRSDDQKERRRRRTKHKIRRDRYHELAASPYYLQPGGVYQIPGTRYGVMRVNNSKNCGLVPIWFDKPGEEIDTSATT